MAEAAGLGEALAQQKADVAERIRLRREVSRLREGKEILKRAVAFFAEPPETEGRA